MTEQEGLLEIKLHLDTARRITEAIASEMIEAGEQLKKSAKKFTPDASPTVVATDIINEISYWTEQFNRSAGGVMNSAGKAEAIRAKITQVEV